MSVSLRPYGAELAENPHEGIGDAVGPDPPRGDPVVRGGRLAESRHPEVAVPAIVQPYELVDARALPAGQQPLDLGMHRLTVLVVEVRRLSGRAAKRAGLLQVV